MQGFIKAKEAAAYLKTTALHCIDGSGSMDFLVYRFGRERGAELRVHLQELDDWGNAHQVKSLNLPKERHV